MSHMIIYHVVRLFWARKERKTIRRKKERKRISNAKNRMNSHVDDGHMSSHIIVTSLVIRGIIIIKNSDTRKLLWCLGLFPRVSKPMFWVLNQHWKLQNCFKAPGPCPSGGIPLISLPCDLRKPPNRYFLRLWSGGKWLTQMNTRA